MEAPSGEIIVTVEESPEGGFPAQGIGHDIFTGTDTLEGLRDAAREAVRCHF
jgi:hypothetical protein